ncbi:cytidylyltransferase domain-containing protein [Heliorestis acidaminivorans]|uniref:acylneuraminate cytidylyltransferase family protein n=1 Tax=Heliorestis acidaminivorans TaxID=553427 RepID=UPI001A9B2917|nr:acylneuraminate cytidylyltransferase family protein [Heliorestis acidaminivorans]
MNKKGSVLALIPARGGSKGIPRKNIRYVGGKPLIAWTIESAKKSKYIDRLVLSSEDEEIIAIAKNWGCDVPFVRPESLAQDDTPGIMPVLHALEVLPEYEYIILLQPTSPLRSEQDIDNCIELCWQNNASACVSVALVDKSPYWMYRVGKDYKMDSIIQSETLYNQRQETPPIFALNGAIYFARAKWLKDKKSFLTSETLAFQMPKERSLDIDTQRDWVFFETIINNGLKN